MTQVLNDMWLTWWTQDSFGLEQWQYELLYILTSMLYALCVFASSLIFAYVGIYGSQNLHINLLHDLLGRKQSFYDVGIHCFQFFLPILSTISSSTMSKLYGSANNAVRRRSHLSDGSLVGSRRTSAQ